MAQLLSPSLASENSSYWRQFICMARFPNEVFCKRAAGTWTWRVFYRRFDFQRMSVRSTARHRETANYNIIIISTREENVGLIKSFGVWLFNNLMRLTQEWKYDRQRKVSNFLRLRFIKTDMLTGLNYKAIGNF